METTVNERIKMLKSQLMLTTMEFCAKTKISTGTFQNIKINQNLNQKTINLICENLNVNPIWLMHGEGEMFLPIKDLLEEIPGTPWKDEAYQNLKTENTTLKKELDRLWQLLQHHMGGATPNFLKGLEKAADIGYLAYLNSLGSVSGFSAKA